MIIGVVMVALGVIMGIWGTVRNKSFGILGTSSVLMAAGVAMFLLGLFSEA